MLRLKSVLIAALTVPLATICGLASAQNRGNDPEPAQQPRAAAPPDRGAQPGVRKMTTEQLLKLWERQSTRLKDLKLLIYRIDKTPGWDEELHYEGSAAFKNPQLAFLDFNKVKTRLVRDPKNPKKSKVEDLVDPRTKTRVSTPYERIVCTGPELWHYRFDKTQIFIYPLDQDAQRRALDEGPLPFLFNMKAQNAQERYQVSLQGEDNTVYFVAIKPKLKEDKENFSWAWICLDRKFLLPVRIILFTPDGQSTRDFQLSKIEANQGVSDDTFRGLKYKGWTVERNPGEAQPDQADRAAPRRNAAGQAAQGLRALDRDQPR
jgi:TIGR03009 family protein